MTKKSLPNRAQTGAAGQWVFPQTRSAARQSVLSVLKKAQEMTAKVRETQSKKSAVI